MWIRIRTVIVEDEPLAAQYLATLLDETLQVEVVGTATDTEAGLRLCAELRPDAVFLDINLPGKDGVSLATQLAMLPQPPRVVFTTGNPARATDAFRLDAVDYLLKPLDPEQISEAIGRLLAILRPFETEHSRSSDGSEEVSSNKMVFTGAANELLPVKDIDRDKIRLLARYEIAAILRHDRRTWVHTVREEFATYYPLGDLMSWLGGDPFIQVGRHAVVNLRAIEEINHYGDRLYRLHLRDRTGTQITASRTGAVRLAKILNKQRSSPNSEMSA
ncbi:MAG: two-component system, LytTR family, response regulator LytT [Verrucomicrobiota bacterium]